MPDTDLAVLGTPVLSQFLKNLVRFALNLISPIEMQLTFGQIFLFVDSLCNNYVGRLERKDD